MAAVRNILTVFIYQIQGLQKENRQIFLKPAVTKSHHLRKLVWLHTVSQYIDCVFLFYSYAIIFLKFFCIHIFRTAAKPNESPGGAKIGMSILLDYL